MTPTPLRLLLVPFALATLLAGSAGCDRGPTATGPEELVIAETILEGDDGEYVFSHSDHWHGAPVVREGESAGFTLHFTRDRLPADDHDMPPIEQWFTLAQHPDHNLRVVVRDTAIARWTGDSVQGTLQGLREGSSVVTFVVRRGTTTIYEAPPLNLRVQPPAP